MQRLFYSKEKSCSKFNTYVLYFVIKLAIIFNF
jgi:hypothetical protein